MTRLTAFRFALLAHQRGQSMIEFIVVLPALIFLVFGIIQWALIYQARNTLNHAAFLAARAGALHNGSTVEMSSGLAAGLAPLFASQASVDGYNAAIARAAADIAQGTATIQILNPTQEVMQDFQRPRLDDATKQEIPNDTLSYRNSQPGTHSKISLQDANILHIRITYCYRLIVPLISNIIHAANSTSGAALKVTGMTQPFGDIHATSVNDPCPTSSGAYPRIPLRTEAVTRMQSPFQFSPYSSP